MAFHIVNQQIRHVEHISAVIFDMDGVLLDTEKLYARFWREAANELGYPMTHQQALGMRSLNRSEGQARLERYFGPGISHPEVRMKRIELMDAYVSVHGVDELPGASEILHRLKKMDVPVALATSSPMDRVKRFLEPLGLLEMFKEIVTGYDVKQGKPAPDIYLCAAERLGLEPTKCIAVEDSPAGIESAYLAGCIPIFIPDQDDLNDEVKDMVYAKADSLLDLLSLFMEGTE